MKGFSYKIAAFLARAILFIFTNLKVKGKENIPERGPLIVVANHIHLLDPPLIILTFLPRWVIFMAKEELFHSWLFGPIVRWAHAFSVWREGTIKEKKQALRQASSVLESGLILGVFPEGTRSPNAKLQWGNPGAAFIALNSNAPILPVAITGTEKIKGIGWFLKRPSITITIGQPFQLPPRQKRLNKSQLNLMTNFIMEHIAALLPPDYQGVYRQG